MPETSCLRKLTPCIETDDHRSIDSCEKEDSLSLSCSRAPSLISSPHIQQEFRISLSAPFPREVSPVIFLLWFLLVFFFFFVHFRSFPSRARTLFSTHCRRETRRSEERKRIAELFDKMATVHLLLKSSSDHTPKWRKPRKGLVWRPI